MSRDLLFKSLKTNWARGDETSSRVAGATASRACGEVPTTDPKLLPTIAEKGHLEKLVALRERAAAGDEQAKKDWQAANVKLKNLRARAQGGDPNAVRACKILSAFRGDRAALEERAARGDEAAKIQLTKKNIRESVKREQREGAEEMWGAGSGREEICGKEEILGEFVGDEERLLRDAGQTERSASVRIRGDYPTSNPSWRRNRRHKGRRLRKLAWKASHGDANAATRLQQVTTRLQQRSAAGDTQATALLQKIQAAQSQLPSQATPYNPAQPATYPPAAPFVANPPPVLNPPLNVTYAAPPADYSDDYEE
jgi:hypothetical protein